jgi:hypothetical protein
VELELPEPMFAGLDPGLLYVDAAVPGVPASPPQLDPGNAVDPETVPVVAELGQDVPPPEKQDGGRFTETEHIREIPAGAPGDPDAGRIAAPVEDDGFPADELEPSDWLQSSNVFKDETFPLG